MEESHRCEPAHLECILMHTVPAHLSLAHACLVPSSCTARQALPHPTRLAPQPQLLLTGAAAHFAKTPLIPITNRFNGASHRPSEGKQGKREREREWQWKGKWGGLVPSTDWGGRSLGKRGRVGFQECVNFLGCPSRGSAD